MLDPIAAVLAATIIAASGAPTAVPEPTPARCEHVIHAATTVGGSEHAAHAADEVVAKIRGLVTEITERARSGSTVDLPIVTAALDHAGLPTPTSADCATPATPADPDASVGTPHGNDGHASERTESMLSAAAARLARRIIAALHDGGFASLPTTTPATRDPAEPDSSRHGDNDNSRDRPGADGDGDGGSDGSRDDGDDVPPRSKPRPDPTPTDGETSRGHGDGRDSRDDGADSTGDGPTGRGSDSGRATAPEKAVTVPLPRESPVPLPGIDPPATPGTLPSPRADHDPEPVPAQPGHSGTAEPTPTSGTASGSASGSAAAAIEQLLGELATALSTSRDPALQQLVDQLRDLLDQGVTAPGTSSTPRAPGALPEAVTDVVPSTVDALFHDDFESGHLGKWGTCQGAGVNGDCANLTAADGMGVTQDPERGLVATFSVTDGEEAEMGGERSEVRDDNNPGTLVTEGDDRWYSWSMKFPADFPEPDGGWNIVMQWHQQANSGSPPLALDISKGSLDIGGDGVGGPRETIGPIHRGAWTDYVLHVKFSKADGFVEAWENGTQTVQRISRPTMTDESNYLKLGIYRDPDAAGDAEVLFDDFAVLGDDAPGLPGPSGRQPDDGTADSSGDSGRDDENDTGASTDPAGRDDDPDRPDDGPPRPAPPTDRPPAPASPERAALPPRPTSDDPAPSGIDV